MGTQKIRQSTARQKFYYLKIIVIVVI